MAACVRPDWTFYLDIFSLPFPLTSREGAFVVRGVRAESAPHWQPGVKGQEQLQEIA